MVIIPVTEPLWMRYMPHFHFPECLWVCWASCPPQRGSDQQVRPRTICVFRLNHSKKRQARCGSDLVWFLYIPQKGFLSLEIKEKFQQKKRHTFWVQLTKCHYTPTIKSGGGAIMDSLCQSIRPSVRLHYRFHSINPIPIEGFSSNLAEKFTSTRGCAEPMCQLKVKVTTIKGQISNDPIWDIMSCLLCKSYTNWKIALILAQMFTSTRACAESMLPFSRLKVKVALEGHKLT